MKTLLVLLFYGFLTVEEVSFARSTQDKDSYSPGPDSSLMLLDIQRLSSRVFSGRQTGTAGDWASGLFVAQRFRELGLVPAGEVGLDGFKGPWGQAGPVTVTLMQPSIFLEFTVGTPGEEFLTFHPELGTTFLPVMDSPSIHSTSPVVFIGYGISDPARGWDEFAGLDVRNCVVMFLRGQPPHYPLHLQHKEKERTARAKGAVGFITLTGPVLGKYAARRGMGHQPLALYTNAQDERPLPGIWISGGLGTKLFQSQGLSLRTIQESLNNKTIQSQALKTRVHMKWDSTQQAGSFVNILGMIPGSDPHLTHETVLLGAHRDHFGKQAGLLFPGADDNASGTALLLEMARLLSTDMTLKRTIVLASFSGEEQNLLGSTWFVQHPTRPLEKTIAMINIDHVGIGNGELTVGVSNMSKWIPKHTAESTGLTHKVNLYGYFPGGDHVPFAKVGVPTIAVVTAGSHSHFHQHSDTFDTIQTGPLQTAARFVLSLTRQIANSD